MRYFSGFGFKNEYELFDFLDDNRFSIAGFSYGAIKALEFTKKYNKRVDKLILISPAFFQNRDEKFKKLQLIFFKKDKNKYMENFYSNMQHIGEINLDRYKKDDSYENLKELLYYKWKEEDLKEIASRNIDLEVYIGEKDKIIDSKVVFDYFKRFGTVYFIKNVGHILK